MVVCIYVSVDECMRICIYPCKYISIYILYISICKFLFVRKSVFVCLNMNVRIYVCICVNECVVCVLCACLGVYVYDKVTLS